LFKVAANHWKVELAALVLAAFFPLVAQLPRGEAATASPTPGIGVLRFGSTSYTVASGYDRYPTVIVDRNYASSASSLPAASKVLVYQAGVDINVNWSTGVTYQEALANGWLLKSASGSYIINAGYPDNYIADIGSASYQQRWASNVASYLASVGADGVFIDDVLGDPALLTNNVWPAKYPTHQAWNDAMASFMAYVGPYLKAHGFYVLINAKNFIPGDPSSNDGTNDVTWWQRLAPNVNGLFSEYWQQDPNNLGTVFSDCGCAWTGWWSKWQRLMTTAQGAGDDFYSEVYGLSTNTRVIRYEKASFLMDWNGAGGGMVWNPTDTGDPWNADWTTDVGTPSGSRFTVGVGWRRNYTGGTVLINPSPSSSQTFQLEAAYVLPGGSSTTSVTLAPLSAMILTSSSTATIPPTTNTSAPVISGSPQAGQVLTTSNGTWSGWIASYSYGWSRCDLAGANCAAVAGASANSYTATSADVGHTLRSTVTASGTSSVSAVSTPTADIAPASTQTAPGPSTSSAAPASTSPPTISGQPITGKTLSASTGSWSPAASSFAYQWSRCNGSCTAVPGATGSSYSLTGADSGFSITVTVAASNSVGSASATSPAVGPIHGSTKK
jgi:Hypothetical glycosyl hydrolase family 15